MARVIVHISGTDERGRAVGRMDAVMINVSEDITPEDAAKVLRTQIPYRDWKDLRVTAPDPNAPPDAPHKARQFTTGATLLRDPNAPPQAPAPAGQVLPTAQAAAVIPGGTPLPAQPVKNG